MEAQIVEAAIEKHLDTLQRTIFFGVPLALALGWAGLRRQESIEVMGLKTTRWEAYAVAVVLVALQNLAVLIILLRVGDLIAGLEVTAVKHAFERMATHPCLFNPFSYFGAAFTARVHSGLGYGFLIICWWIGFTAVSLLKFGRPPDNTASIFGTAEILLVSLGVASMFAANRCYDVIRIRLRNSDPEYANAIAATTLERMVLAVMFIFVGAIIYYATHVL